MPVCVRVIESIQLCMFADMFCKEPLTHKLLRTHFRPQVEGEN